MASGVRIQDGVVLLEEGGEALPLYSGAVHYWRLAPALWRDVLTGIRGLGFRIVETYVPWSVHETAPGTFDFTGARDFPAFLQLCSELELYVIARPGPHCNAELTWFGYPERVVEDPRMQALTASGTPGILVVPPKPFPIVSYASEPFFQEAARWFDAVCPILACRQYPDGPVIAIQADNELSFFFKLTPYDVDFSPAAQVQYRSFLEQRYGDIDALNRAYSTDYDAFAAIEPPHDFDAVVMQDLPRYLDWAAAKEHYLTAGIVRIRNLLRERGIDRVPIFHNTPQVYNVPCNQVAVEQDLAFQGVDFYAHAEDYDPLKRVCLYLAGTSRLPAIPEFGAGNWPWWRPMRPVDDEANALVALMHGLKGFTYYMLVERERWMGSPIGRRGDVREPQASFYRRLLAFLHSADLAHFRRTADVVLLYARDYERHAFASRAISPPFFPEVLGPLGGLMRHRMVEVCLERDLGLGTSIPQAMRSWWEACYAALCQGSYAFVLGDTESDLAWLQRYRAVICPGFAYCSRTVQERLAAYAAAGGTLLMGPELPALDERMQPCTILRDATAVQCIRHPADLLDALATASITPPATIDNPALDLALHVQGERRLLFTANSTALPQRGTLRLGGAARLCGLWEEGMLIGSGTFTLTLAPHAVQVWEVQPC